MAMPSRPMSQGGFQIFPLENEGYGKPGGGCREIAVVGTLREPGSEQSRRSLAVREFSGIKCSQSGQLRNVVVPLMLAGSQSKAEA